jgi:hypothetical protein
MEDGGCRFHPDLRSLFRMRTKSEHKVNWSQALPSSLWLVGKGGVGARAIRVIALIAYTAARAVR